MKKTIIIAVVILIVSQLSFAQQINLEQKSNKMTIANELRPIYVPKKVHPIEKLMKANKPKNNNTRSNNRLLVLLVDFQEDDDSETTGNGKFDLRETSTYQIPLDSPPHDNVYYSNQLIALNKYYLAVSHGSFDVKFDIFPAYGSENMAYTLPRQMAYYNPGVGDPDLMLARFEEYFTDVFTVADKDESITFGDYDHYMIIHAGADWQHDRAGDSPHDMPSFFINVGDGKEVVVDDGATTIRNASNIPETITQDVREEDGVFFNYGVINAVMVHEFGHSLGFVDLYNTSDNSPGVGYYDIMDSGGSVLAGTGFEDIEGDYYIEGMNPVFPGAFSRIIAFEDFYRANGMLKDISELPFGEDITVLPIAKKYYLADLDDSTVFIVKIPLSDSEYLLVENRQVDPDGDGGMRPICGLASSIGKRVVLGPSSMDKYDTNFNYEYDWLLPGWMDSEGKEFGGGLLVWHVDEKLLYENNNFENNTVNTNYYRRAVKILEADDIDDIANQYSHFWQGTVYDPFFKYQPIIDERGFFEGWDNQYQTNPDGSVEFVGKIAGDELSASSSPRLVTNDGTPSIFRLYDISSYDINYHAPNSGFEGRVLTFKFGTNLFDETQVIEFDSDILEIGRVGNTFGLNTLSVVSEDIHLYSKLTENWDEHLGTSKAFEGESTQPIFSADINADGNDENMIVSHDKLYTYDGQNIEVDEFESEITSSPLYLDDFQLLIIPTENKLHIGNDVLEISNARLAFDSEEIVAVSGDKIYFISTDGEINEEITISNLDEQFYPVCYDDSNDEYDATFVQDAKGDIWKIQNYQATKIFNLSGYSSELPTNLAIGDILQDNVPYLIFAAGDRAFAITTSGTLAPDFPGYLENRSFTAASFPKIVKFDEKVICYFASDQSYLSVDSHGDFVPEYSLSWDMAQAENQFFWLEDDKSLNYAYTDEKSLYLASKYNVSSDPIIWNGFRNNGMSLFTGAIPNFAVTSRMSAEVFPNPVKNGEARIRVYNAPTDISLKIFDVAGNLLFSKKNGKENNVYQDLIWSCPKISSGVYFAIVTAGSETKKLSIAILK